MNRVLFDVAALISRVTIGVIFVAHGWQKWQNGLDATTGMFTQAGVPQPELAAGFTTVAETVGGSFLILGLLTRIAALCLLAVSVGAIAYVHAWNGLFITNNGWELVGALAAACLLFVALGAGRISIDGIFRSLFGKRAEQKAAEKAAAAKAAEPVAVVQEKVVVVPAPQKAEPAAAPAAPLRPEQAASDAAVMDEAVKSAVQEKKAAASQEWSEEDLKDIDALFADDKKPPTG
ncbi:DoxX family protein [Nonomuraea sp. NPDC050556]|uniref:DoxX family protein n=1 Tax=Nonomuraea sp. NPDC050556 TaxID=3364369 RepID=UPI00379A5D92